MTTELSIAGEVGVHVTYGLGGVAEGRFSRDAVAGKSARELIRSVVQCDQAPGPAARTAKVLGDVMRRKGALDVELVDASSDGEQGQPIRLDDVVLKERRTLLIAIRETPIHSGHLENLLRLSRMGAVIFPPVPAFYNRPVTLQDIVDQSCMRMLDQFEIHIESAPRWGEEGGVPAVGQQIEGGKPGT